MKVQIIKYLNSEGNVVETRKSNFKGRDLPENILQEYEVEIKCKGSAWYEDENMVGKLVIDTFTNNIHIFNSYSIRHNEILVGVQNSFICKRIDQVRPATESEVLSLVYKPQQKVSKEINPTESNRLKDLFLDDKAECLVENEQEFKLVYDFLDKERGKSLNRKFTADEYLKHSAHYRKFPIVLFTQRIWRNLFEWNKLEDRDKSKPLIKFNGEVFWEVIE